MKESDDLAAVVEQVVRRLRREGLSWADAEDCVQEALLALLVKQADPDAEQVLAVRAWLTVTARRKLLDQLRRADREQRALAHPRTIVPDAPGPADVVTDQGLARWLAKSLDELPEDTRRVCRLVAAGLSTEDIAAQSGLTCRSVQSHLTRARRLLRHLAASAAVVLAGTLARLTRHTAATAVTTPVALTAAAAIYVVSLPHHTPLPQQPSLPPVAAQAPSPAGPTLMPVAPQHPDPTSGMVSSPAGPTPTGTAVPEPATTPTASSQDTPQATAPAVATPLAALPVNQPGPEAPRATGETATAALAPRHRTDTAADQLHATQHRASHRGAEQGDVSAAPLLQESHGTSAPQSAGRVVVPVPTDHEDQRWLNRTTPSRPR
ncbi:RNA polymerase sigma factor, sigma-70 family [Lentzea xinjiangensis]|uniref:RNA polymerase sigma factor, sigma-70 family n=1 Tax=Lentzea xinjiangensis TaxID=402600 RepID=A0A1H9VYQ1_9PSEU|nr:sigma-70 family RNA polymerase sigma factor [Lentzea xinjiangensis]SES26752.1 RNA polymerase sigma factor, sigma-70 family [Lentzea xinjiangensis]